MRVLHSVDGGLDCDHNVVVVYHWFIKYRLIIACVRCEYRDVVDGSWWLRRDMEAESRAIKRWLAEDQSARLERLRQEGET